MNTQTLTPEAEGGVEPSKTIAITLPPDAAHSYICDMLDELTQIAAAAELENLAVLLRLTVTAAKLSAK